MNKYISWIAIGLGVVAVVLAVVGGNFNQPQIGSTTQQNAEGSRFPNGISSGEGSLIWNREVLSAGSNQSYVLNDSGKTMCSILSTVSFGGTASSSITVDVATSTSSSFDKDYEFFTSDPNGSLIDSRVISTSTPEFMISSLTDGNLTQKVVCAANGEYFLYMHRSTFDLESMAPCDVDDDNNCDTATSTELGVWPIEWNMLLTATSTQ